MTNINEIHSKLMTSDSAVEKAMLVLSQGPIEISAWDKQGADYYARWVLSGKKLNGSFLDKARLLALKYVEDLLVMVLQNQSGESPPRQAPRQQYQPRRQAAAKPQYAPRQASNQGMMIPGGIPQGAKKVTFTFEF